MALPRTHVSIAPMLHQLLWCLFRAAAYQRFGTIQLAEAMKSVAQAIDVRKAGWAAINSGV